MQSNNSIGKFCICIFLVVTLQYSGSEGTQIKLDIIEMVTISSDPGLLKDIRMKSIKKDFSYL